MIDKETAIKYQRELDAYYDSIIPKINLYTGKFTINPDSIRLSEEQIEFSATHSKSESGRFYVLPWDYFNNPEEWIKNKKKEKK